MKYLVTRLSHIGRLPLGFKALILTALLTAFGFFTFGNHAWANPNLGQGKVINVVPVNTECVAGPTGNGVQSWDVQQGGTYDVTIAGVTDAGNGGTDPTIEVVSRAGMKSTFALASCWRVSLKTIALTFLRVQWCTFLSAG
jgi:hypothetical protein